MPKRAAAILLDYFNYDLFHRRGADLRHATKINSRGAAVLRGGMTVKLLPSAQLPRRRTHGHPISIVHIAIVLTAL